jgi:hypothetical protein
LLVKILRTSTALGLVAAPLLLLGLPLCYSSACPMSPAEREVCKAMGRECCGTRGGQVSHGPAAPVPVLACGPAAFTVAGLASETVVSHDLFSPVAAPAVLQGVGLFVLFAVFLI